MKVYLIGGLSSENRVSNEFWTLQPKVSEFFIKDTTEDIEVNGELKCRS